MKHTQKINKQELELLYTEQREPYSVIAEKLGCSKHSISYYLKIFKIKRRPSSLDITDRQFGTLIPKYIKERKNKHIYWYCECNCGGNAVVTQAHLMSGHTKTCGNRIHREAENHPLWTGHKCLSGAKFAFIKLGAVKRNIEFDVSIEYLYDLYKKQEGKCALTGLDLILTSNNINNTASVDRIDSYKGYIEGNLQWVHKDVNIMKQAYSQNYFIMMCKLVSLHSFNADQNEINKIAFIQF